MIKKVLFLLIIFSILSLTSSLYAVISNGDIDDENFSDITDWVDSDNGDAVSSAVTFDSKLVLKQDTGTLERARIYQDVGTFGARTVFSFSAYFDAIGATAATSGDNYWFYVEDGTYRMLIEFVSSGLFAWDGAGFNEVGTDLVVLDEWHEWTFDVTWGSTVDVYLDNSLVGNDIDISYTAAGTNGRINLYHYGDLTNNRISYIDWMLVGSDFAPSTSGKQFIWISE